MDPYSGLPVTPLLGTSTSAAASTARATVPYSTNKTAGGMGMGMSRGGGAVEYLSGDGDDDVIAVQMGWLTTPDGLGTWHEPYYFKFQLKNTFYISLSFVILICCLRHLWFGSIIVAYYAIYFSL
jgi:hypothetical protein